MIINTIYIYIKNIWKYNKMKWIDILKNILYIFNIFLKWNITKL